jgi:flagellar biosynthesis protein FliR
MTGATFSLAGGQVAALFLVFLRTTGFVVAAPLFGHRAVPSAVKAGIAALLAVSIVSQAVPAQNGLPMVIAAPVEVVIGLVLGFLLGLGMRATELIARLLSLQGGLSLGSVFGPTFDESGSALDPLFAVLSGLLFLGMGLHLALVGALARSYTAMPLGAPLGIAFADFAARLVALVLDLGVQLALPLALVLLLAELAVALLSRAIPTINVFVLGMPITLLAAFVVLLAALPALLAAIGQVFETVFRSVNAGALP